MQPDEKKQLDKLVADVSDLTKNIYKFMRESGNFNISAGKDIEQIKKDITEINLLVKDNYVRREEFNPVQKIVYGLVSVILMGVIGALMALVLK